MNTYRTDQVEHVADEIAAVQLIGRIFGRGDDILQLVKDGIERAARILSSGMDFSVAVDKLSSA